MVIHEDAWRQFKAVALAIYWHHKIALENHAEGRAYCPKHDHLTHEPDIFDVFNMIRERELGGWSYTQKGMDALDAEIEREYQAGKW